MEQIPNSYEEFINLINSYDYEQLKNIVMTYKNILTSKNKNDKLINYSDNLIKKLKNNELSELEINIISRILSVFIIEDSDVKDTTLYNLFVTKYFNKITDSSRTIILILELVNLLNKEYDKNNEIYFYHMKSKNSIAFVSESFPNTIFLNKEIFIKIVNKKHKENIDIKLYVISIILHEFKHILQHDNYKDIYRIEDNIITWYNKIYKIFHDEFYIERDAINFSKNNLFKYYCHFFEVTKKDIKHIIKFMSISRGSFIEHKIYDTIFKILLFVDPFTLDERKYSLKY